MPRIVFDSFSIAVPQGWEDITDSVESDEPPPTLAREDGIGALQFSTALYTDGTVPDPRPEDLSQMVASFAEAQGLGPPRHLAVESEPLRLAAGSFTTGCDFLRVWQISDRHNFALVTYICESGLEGRELGECEQVVRSLRLQRAGGL